MIKRKLQRSVIISFYIILQISGVLILAFSYQTKVTSQRSHHVFSTNRKTQEVRRTTSFFVMELHSVPLSSVDDNMLQGSYHDQFLSLPNDENDDQRYGMPWHTSIAPYKYPPNEQKTLLFMPYWEYTDSILRGSGSQLTNLRQIRSVNPSHTYASVNSPSKQKTKKSRMVNLSYSCDEYRKIRMMYYDAGDSVQVFNSVWYPNPELGNLPIMGMELLAFSRRKYLVGFDFQPLPNVDQCYLGMEATLKSKLEKIWNKEKRSGEERLEVIYERLPNVLKGKISNRFYDENQFFSKYMLFSRFNHSEEDLVYPRNCGLDDDNSNQNNEGIVFDLFKEYIQTHINMVKNSSSVSQSDNTLRDTIERTVKEGHKQYDVYNLKRDPAHSMLSGAFGREWTNGFMKSLFDFSGACGP